MARKPRTPKVKKSSLTEEEKELYRHRKVEKIEEVVVEKPIVLRTIQFTINNQALVAYESLDPSLKVTSKHLKFILSLKSFEENKQYLVTLVEDEGFQVSFKEIV